MKKIMAAALATVLVLSCSMVAFAVQREESSPTGGDGRIDNIIFDDSTAATEQSEPEIAITKENTGTVIVDSPTNNMGEIKNIIVVDAGIMPLGSYTDYEVPANTAVFFAGENVTRATMSVSYKPTNVDLYFGLGTKSDGTGTHYANKATGGSGSATITPAKTTFLYPYLANGTSKVIYADFDYTIVTALRSEGETASMSASVSGDVVDVSAMKVGDIIYVGDIAIEKGPDDAPPPVETRVTKGGYNAYFNGELDDREYLDLNNTYKYFYIWSRNDTDSEWMVTIGNTEEIQDRNYHVVGEGTFYIWSTKAWDPEETLVGYTCGSGMYGQTAARLCSTLKEAEDHTN